MDFKLMGAILLIIATTIGGGMLALPIATSEIGFLGSVILLVACWALMTLGAYLILEVNLYLSPESNLISMAKQTIGPLGQLLAWVTYLLLLYSLLCAYIGGGSGLLQNLLTIFNVELSHTPAAFLFTGLLSSFVFLGIRSVDYVNRVLMSLKFLAYFLLVGLLIPFIKPNQLNEGNLFLIHSSHAISITITAFGFAALIPSLRVYFNSDVRKLKIAIFVGSIIPLILYILWDAVIMGIIPLEGSGGLIAMLKENASTQIFVSTLTHLLNKESITMAANLFTSVCMMTSFLGVGLCLMDFLTDGLSLSPHHNKASRIGVYLLTFLPPLSIVLYAPNIFIKALEYGGLYCIVLLILLPAWMAWSGRQKNKQGPYQVCLGKNTLIIIMLISVGLILQYLLMSKI